MAGPIADQTASEKINTLQNIPVIENRVIISRKKMWHITHDDLDVGKLIGFSK